VATMLLRHPGIAKAACLSGLNSKVQKVFCLRPFGSSGGWSATHTVNYVPDATTSTDRDTGELDPSPFRSNGSTVWGEDGSDELWSINAPTDPEVLC